ncbi:hypothetical protein LUZ61_006422 [Rhynchospora tenuis]|uniref:Dirigent protein n=1 Tax=Rhynchospora tenuis TaxID=198213 RepID=A0AAD6EVI2_9POAL|nr:hypothetical protein LUZ61_006422 [Rhynchospora tenuis]
MEPGRFTITTVKNNFRGRLYLHHSLGTQRVVVNTGNSGFGSIAINDWLVYDGLGSNKKVIARARGVQHNTLNTNTPFARWNITFYLEFENDGSRIDVRGQLNWPTEWTIIGGTGKFARAEGIIYADRVQESGGTNILELNIDGTCAPSTKKSP